MENQTQTMNPSPSKATLSSVGELLKQSIEIYKQGFKKFLTLQFIPFVSALALFIVIGVWMMVNLFFKSVLNPLMVNIIFGFLGLIVLLFAIYISLLSQIAFLMMLKNFDFSKKIKDLFAESRPHLLNFVGIFLLVGLICLAGLVLFIVPGLLFIVWYSFAIYVYIFEGIKGWAALKKSKGLVKGYWWPVAWRLLVLMLISLLISVPAEFFPNDSATQNLYNLIASIVKFLISPIFVIYPYLIYKNLVKINNA